MLIDIDYTCEQLDDLLAEPATMRVKNFLLDLRNCVVRIQEQQGDFGPV